ncbi:MAG: threonine/serine exporter family protein [Acetobacteraceae bacterium]
MTTAAEAHGLIAASAVLLLANGQTTERTVSEVERLAGALGCRVAVLPRWGEIVLQVTGAAGPSRAAGTSQDIIAVAPTGVDMGKVADTVRTIDALCEGRIDAAAAQAGLDRIARHPPVSLARFVVLAAAGAAALAVIFGAAHLVSLALIAASAGAGAALRRWLAGRSHNPFVQPFCAALLAGGVGALAARLQLSSVLHLVAVCPCMVLVPGPHILNGTIDLVRARIALGASRLLFAGLIVVAICIGLLAGLYLGGVSLPVSGPSSPVPLAYDVLAAGVAVAAYGTFFDMPWRTLPIPIAIGMAAHALRWMAISLAGAGAATGALIACLAVGTIVTPVADRLRLPFAAFAFASVVSLIPGVFLFRMAGGLVALASLGEQAPPALLTAAIADGSTAALIVAAMTFGLIVPKMCFEHLRHALHRSR